MSARVNLTAIRGTLKGQKFPLSGKTQCILGRAHSCDVQVPAADYTVSRRHCVLDLDPQGVRVRDLGSLNGTFLNGEMIGRRDKRLDAAEAALIPQNRYTLEDGDELRLGDLVFRVQIASEPVEAEEVKENAGSSCLICI